MRAHRPAVTSTPALPLPKLAGAPNFRDLGGRIGQDGRTVRFGRILRSQGLQALTDDDLAALQALDIRLVCDLRSHRERHLHPSRWPAASTATRLEFDIRADIRAHNRELVDILRSAPGAQGARDMMLASYQSFPLTFAEPLAMIFAALLRDAGPPLLPLLVHCAAGKDRTGFIIAMLASALGVPRELIIEDYLQVRQVALTTERMRATASAMAALLGYVPDDEAVAVISNVHEDYLQAAFASIEAHFGGIDRYLGRCGLDQTRRQRLVEAMLD